MRKLGKVRKLTMRQAFKNSIKIQKKTWQLLREVTEINPPKANILEININGTLTTDPKLMADSFNDFFSSVGTKISETVLPSNTDPLSYCNYPGDIPPLDLGGAGPILITDIIKVMQNKSSTDLDGISALLLKNIATEISLPLSHIFNLSLTTGIFPEKLKTSRVIPIHKTGDPTLQ